MGSGLALFPRLEYALAHGQIELIPAISALCLTCAGFSCKSCRSETCACAFAAPHSFSTVCSLIQPADTPTFSKLLLFSVYAEEQGKQLKCTLKQQVHPYQYLTDFFLEVGMFIWYKLRFLWRGCVEGTAVEERNRKGLCAEPFTCVLAGGLLVRKTEVTKAWPRYRIHVIFHLFSSFQVCVQRELRKNCSLS